MERDRESGLPGLYFQLPLADDGVRTADDVDEEFVAERSIHSCRPLSIGRKR